MPARKLTAGRIVKFPSTRIANAVAISAKDGATACATSRRTRKKNSCPRQQRCAAFRRTELPSGHDYDHQDLKQAAREIFLEERSTALDAGSPVPVDHCSSI